ncbi:hydroxymethylbilane synthase [Candidatus Chrysopegis kryptomonas]|jgi:hydroxymethylbilane synthase|uniref:Porphobilinogen deaminase n=1 Tax=Candidatus Chryseopegocella kryptomonas TaxID=1633643 RepID=A0A0P1MP90_9BACT|nr:hydroxymethylbilane synthase [Candidatus Chrysopegis kryptomonas]CUS97644.1 hydroxymethylbilane synthase [Candidatus Chrysopegis kryptomonas]
MRKIIIGTRGSKLALWQTEFVKKKLSENFPDLEFEIKIIKTKGDKILDSPLSKIGDKGIFTREIEIELLNGEIDLAVHSLKDLPTKLPDGLIIGAVTEREDVRDVLISKNNLKLSELPTGATIATGSLRRKAQLLHFRGDFKFVDLRGNIDTRFRKFDESNWDGMVLAFAGVSRMNYLGRVSEIISTDVILPAVGQGAIAVEIRERDEKIFEIVRKINHSETELATKAERALLKYLEGGCQIPIGAFASLKDGKIKLSAMISNLDGTFLVRDSIEKEIGNNVEEVGFELAQRLLEQGGAKILDEIRKLSS